MSLVTKCIDCGKPWNSDFRSRCDECLEKVLESQGAVVTLREELARRLEISLTPLYPASGEAGHMAISYEYSLPDDAWLVLADEVIRQMEWARRERSGQVLIALLAKDYEGARAIIESQVLTLAPPEWKP